MNLNIYFDFGINESTYNLTSDEALPIKFLIFSCVINFLESSRCSSYVRVVELLFQTLPLSIHFMKYFKYFMIDISML